MSWIIGLTIAIVVGVIVGGLASDEGRKPGRGQTVGTIAVIVLVLIVTAVFSIRIIDPGEAGVRIAFGDFAGDPLPNGLHWVAPWVDVINYETRTLEFTMVAELGEGAKKSDDSVTILSKDNMPMGVDLTIFYSVKPDKLNDLHETYGMNYKGDFIRPMARTVVRDVFGQFDGKPAASTQRNEVGEMIGEKLGKKLEKFYLNVQGINLRDVQPPKSVLDAISAKVAAEEKVKQAEFDADRKVTIAQGEADANRIVANSITDRIIAIEQIKAWEKLAQSDNSKVIIPAGGNMDLLITAGNTAGN